MFVIFEGLDKAGKGTLECEFLKATDFKHIVIDRGPAGYYTFDLIFDRTTMDGAVEFLKCAQVAMDTQNFMVVYCKVNSALAIKRMHEHNEECPYNYEVAQGVYDSCVKSFYDDERVVVVDTAMPIEECVRKIIEKLEVLKGEHD